MEEAVDEAAVGRARASLLLDMAADAGIREFSMTMARGDTGDESVADGDDDNGGDGGRQGDKGGERRRGRTKGATVGARKEGYPHGHAQQNRLWSQSAKGNGGRGGGKRSLQSGHDSGVTQRRYDGDCA